MSGDLRERVARALCAEDNDGNEDVYDLQNNNFRSRYDFMADAAIALVLEEAARVAETTFGEGYHIAAAIRALKENPDA